MTPGDEDDYSYHAHDIRRARITNHGDEIAYNVTLDEEATGLEVVRFEPKALNKGDWLEFEFRPPSVVFTTPDGKEYDHSDDYTDTGVAHPFRVTFQRDKDLGGDTRSRTFRYEDVYGYKGRLPGDDD